MVTDTYLQYCSKCDIAESTTEDQAAWDNDSKSFNDLC